MEGISIFRASQVALVVKNLPANAGATGDAVSILESGRSPGGGCGNPLQYSGLENPRDGGAWWAVVHGVAKSWTRLKWLSTHVLSGSTSRAYRENLPFLGSQDCQRQSNLSWVHAASGNSPSWSSYREAGPPFPWSLPKQLRRETDTKIAAVTADKGHFPLHLEASFSRVIASGSWTMWETFLLGKTPLFLSDNKNGVIYFMYWFACFSFPQTILKMSVPPSELGGGVRITCWHKGAVVRG